MFKKLFIILSTSILFILCTFGSASAVTMQDNQVVDTNKTWLIRFSSAVKLSENSNQYMKILDEGNLHCIKILDSKGNDIKGDTQVGLSTNTVIIHAPSGGYLTNEYYTLIVDKGFKDTNGKNLKQPVMLHFTVTATEDKELTFKDANLEYKLRNIINKPSGKIYASDFRYMTSINLRYTGDHLIKDLSGIENLVNTEDLILDGNSISDLSCLTKLPKLQDLWLESMGISDISQVKYLQNLVWLNLEHNKISDLSPVAGLKYLEKLDAYDNKISDINILSNLNNLNDLNLANNKISDISALKGLYNLETLYLHNNQISGLSNNQISDISSLRGLYKLQNLYLDDNKISNISSLSGLINLKILYLNDNIISDISPMKNLNNLNHLELVSNKISDISALKGLSNLTYLAIWYNQISLASQQQLKVALPKCNILF